MTIRNSTKRWGFRIHEIAHQYRWPFAVATSSRQFFIREDDVLARYASNDRSEPDHSRMGIVSHNLADQTALGKRPSTLGRRLAAIRYFHRAANEASPTSEERVKTVLAGIRRTVGAAPVRKKAATSDIVIAMAAEGKSLRALRNRAVLLLGFAGAFRRSELVALNAEDLEETQLAQDLRSDRAQEP